MDTIENATQTDPRMPTAKLRGVGAGGVVLQIRQYSARQQLRAPAVLAPRPRGAAGRERGPRGVVERALQALEVIVLQNIDEFEAQHVSSTLHIMAKSRYRPWDKLEGRAEALAGTFNAQGVTNTLWAYATMGRAPGAGVMWELEGRAEAVAGSFNAHGVANTLWAVCVLSIFAPSRKKVD
jgi:hypothetical protein